MLGEIKKCDSINTVGYGTDITRCTTAQSAVDQNITKMLGTMKMNATTRKVSKAVGKAGFLVFLGVYVLSLPFYYVLVAIPNGLVDYLLPLEAVACLGTSILCFGWAGITVKETIKL